MINIQDVLALKNISCVFEEDAHGMPYLTFTFSSEAETLAFDQMFENNYDGDITFANVYRDLQSSVSLNGPKIKQFIKDFDLDVVI